MKKTLLILSVFALIISCANGKKMSRKNKKTISKAILVDSFTDYARSSSDIQILSTSVTDSILSINVSYSGGCKDHDFKLIGSKILQKSMPPIRGIFLVHNSNADDCRELIEQELKFNISDFKYVGGEVMLKLDGYKPKIKYSSSKK